MAKYRITIMLRVEANSATEAVYKAALELHANPEEVSKRVEYVARA